MMNSVGDSYINDYFILRAHFKDMRKFKTLVKFSFFVAGSGVCVGGCVQI